MLGGRADRTTDGTAAWWRRRIRTGRGHAVAVESAGVHRLYRRAAPVLVQLTTTDGPPDSPSVLVHQYALTTDQARKLAARLIRAAST